MTISWLTKLRETFEARTKGDWSLGVNGAVRSSLPPDFGIKKLNAEFADHKPWCCYVGERENNGNFIALCGTIGDELLNVVEAAEAVRTYNAKEDKFGIEKLDEALAVLKAKVEAQC